MDKIGKDYLAKKARELGLWRAEALTEIQRLLDQRYPGQTRALSLNKETLKVITPNATVSSQLRFDQVKLLIRIRAVEGAEEVTRLQIQIRSLN